MRRSLRADPKIPAVFDTIIPEGERIAASAEFVPNSTLREKYGAGTQGYFEYYLTVEIMKSLRA
jgi:hypothetical protein